MILEFKMLNVSAERIYTSFAKLCSGYLKDSLITSQGKKKKGRVGEKRKERKKVIEKVREWEYTALLTIANLRGVVSKVLGINYKLNFAKMNQSIVPLHLHNQIKGKIQQHEYSTCQ